MAYPTDVTEKEWKIIERLLRPKSRRGRKAKHNKRKLLNAILYVVKGGISWRMIPKDFPSWKTVYTFLRRLCIEGRWEAIFDYLNQRYRKKIGKNMDPSYATADSQSVKTQLEVMTVEKKIKGRKRHIGVDTLGNLLHVNVHSAQEHDTKSGCKVFLNLLQKYPTLKAFSADAGYHGTAKKFVEQQLHLPLNISTKIVDTFAVLPKRWIVERTFAWLSNFRRLAKDFEITTCSQENMIRLAMIKITLKKCLA